MPALVCTLILVLVVSCRSCTKRAKQRTPFPHCSTSEPSALKIRYLKSASGTSGGSTISN